jgi:hypothetical protein
MARFFSTAGCPVHRKDGPRRAAAGGALRTLDGVNSRRASPAWLLPAVLAILVIAVVVGAILR